MRRKIIAGIIALAALAGGTAATAAAASAAPHSAPQVYMHG